VSCLPFPSVLVRAQLVPDGNLRHSRGQVTLGRFIAFVFDEIHPRQVFF
jgi:hypothetical protein